MRGWSAIRQGRVGATVSGSPCVARTGRTLLAKSEVFLPGHSRNLGLGSTRGFGCALRRWLRPVSITIAIRISLRRDLDDPLRTKTSARRLQVLSWPVRVPPGRASAVRSSRRGRAASTTQLGTLAASSRIGPGSPPLARVPACPPRRRIGVEKETIVNGAAFDDDGGHDQRGQREGRGYRHHHDAIVAGHASCLRRAVVPARPDYPGVTKLKHDLAGKKARPMAPVVARR